MKEVSEEILRASDRAAATACFRLFSDSSRGVGIAARVASTKLLLARSDTKWTSLSLLGRRQARRASAADQAAGTRDREKRRPPLPPPLLIDCLFSTVARSFFFSCFVLRSLFLLLS